MKRFIICVKGVGLSKEDVLEEMKKTNLEVDDIGSLYIAKTTVRNSF